jgi:hypothetical protein
VDDTRYLATLMRIDGTETAARDIVASSLAKGDNRATIRRKLTERMCGW